MNLSMSQLRLLGAVLQDAVQSNRLAQIAPDGIGEAMSPAELETLAQALSSAEIGYIASCEPVIVIAMDGGLVRGLDCNTEPPPIRMISADRDAEEHDDDDPSRGTFTVPGEDKPAVAWLWEWEIATSPEYVAAVEAAHDRTLEAP